MLFCWEKTFFLKVAKWLQPKHVGDYTNVIVQYLVSLINLYDELNLFKLQLLQYVKLLSI
jgi:hypothetical protein